MKRLLSTPLSLILAVFLLASSLVSCPDPSITTSGTETGGLSFIQSGTCGFGGSNNPDVESNDEFEGPAWTVSNNNWGGGIVFTIDLGSETLADYSGFKCTIRRDSIGLAWKDIYLEHALTGPFRA